MNIDKLKRQVEEKINNVQEQGISTSNLEILSKLVDIHKDLCNEEYWIEKEEGMGMNYRNSGEYGEYGNYGRRGVPGSGRGRRYGRRGVPGTGRYQGDDMMEEMYERYQEYSDGRNGGNYSGKSTMKSLEYMLESVVDFMEMLKQDASSQEEIQLIQEYCRKISEM